MRRTNRAGGKKQQAEYVASTQWEQVKLRGIEFCQVGDADVEQLQAKADDEPGGEAATQALKHAVVKEGAADEGVGCTDQRADLDFFTLRQDLQTDGVAGDHHQGKTEQNRKNQGDIAAEAHHGVKALCPGGIQQYLVHFGQLHQIVAQVFELIRVDAFGLDHEGVRQRVPFQPRGHVDQPGALQELLQSLVALDEAELFDGIELLQPRLDLPGAVGICARGQEHGDLGFQSDVAGNNLDIFDQRIKAKRQAERDTKDDHGEQAGKGAWAKRPRISPRARRCWLSQFIISSSPCFRCNTRLL